MKRINREKKKESREKEWEEIKFGLKPKPENKLTEGNFIGTHGKKSVLDPTKLDMEMKK